METYYRQNFTDIIMKHQSIKTSFDNPEGPKAWDNKTGIKLKIFILIFTENCLQYDAIHDFSLWLRTGSNPADSNRFQSHTENFILKYYNN